jgi:hypothetical protein
VSGLLLVVAIAGIAVAVALHARAAGLLAAATLLVGFVIGRAL